MSELSVDDVAGAELFSPNDGRHGAGTARVSVAGRLFWAEIKAGVSGKNNPTKHARIIKDRIDSFLRRVSEKSVDAGTPFQPERASIEAFFENGQDESSFAGIKRIELAINQTIWQKWRCPNRLVREFFGGCKQSPQPEISDKRPNFLTSLPPFQQCRPRIVRISQLKFNIMRFRQS